MPLLYSEIDIFKEIPMLNDEPDEKLEQIVFDATRCLTSLSADSSFEYLCDKCSLQYYVGDATSLCAFTRGKDPEWRKAESISRSFIALISQIILELKKRKERQICTR